MNENEKLCENLAPSVVQFSIENGSYLFAYPQFQFPGEPNEILCKVSTFNDIFVLLSRAQMEIFWVSAWKPVRRNRLNPSENDMDKLRHDVEMIKIIKNFSEAPLEEDFPEPVMLVTHMLCSSLFLLLLCVRTFQEYRKF